MKVTKKCLVRATMKLESKMFKVLVITALLQVCPYRASGKETDTKPTEPEIKLTKNQAQAPQSVDNRFFGLGNLFGQLFPGGQNNGNQPAFGQNNYPNNFPGLNQRPVQGSFPNQGQFNQNPGQWNIPDQIQGGSPNEGQWLNPGRNQNFNPGQWQTPNQVQGNLPVESQWQNQGQQINQSPSTPSQWQNPSNRFITNPASNQNINYPGQLPDQGQNFNQVPPGSGNWINPGQNQNQGTIINPDQWQNQGNIMDPNQFQNQNQANNVANPNQWQNQNQGDTFNTNQRNPALWQNQGGVNQGQMPNENQFGNGQLANPGNNQNIANPQWQSQGTAPDQLNFPGQNQVTPGQWQNTGNQNQGFLQNPNQWQSQGNQNSISGVPVTSPDTSQNNPGQTIPAGTGQNLPNGQTGNAAVESSNPSGSGTNNSGTATQSENNTNTIPNQQQCVLSCPVTNEYNPICGSNNISYANPASFQCAQRCGVNVEISRRGRCPNDSPFRNGL